MGCVAGEENAPQQNRKLGGADAPKDEFAAAELDPAQAKKVALKTAARDMLNKAKETSAEDLQKMADDMDSVGDGESEDLKSWLLDWVKYQKKIAESVAAQAKYEADLAEYNRSTASAEGSAQAEKDRVAQEAQAQRDSAAKAEQDEKARQQYQRDHATPQQEHRMAHPGPIYGVSNAESVQRSDPEGAHQRQCAQHTEQWLVQQGQF